ncbi:MAG: hypothetical protein ISR73_09390, partial [Gammaproteobacteria bacterium]|nr:hypothetical protein [Gammaproteobacteria bacterium]
MNDDPENNNAEIPLERLETALESADESRIAQLVENMTSQEALRQMSLLHVDDRDQLLTLLTPEAAA